MRLRNVTGSREVIADSIYVIHDEKEKRGQWKSVFGNNNPIHIEIGMGKGTFIMEKARKYPDINFIGIEKYSSVLIRAIEKRVLEPEIQNLYLIRMDAEEIEEVFAPSEIDFIYLNFSDPWPKDRHAKRRLTSDRFLGRYINILSPQGGIIFKTDNNDLFDFSVEQAKECNWNIVRLTRDLHKSEYSEGNIMTEYEKKFSEQGNPINMMEYYPPETLLK